MPSSWLTNNTNVQHVLLVVLIVLAGCSSAGTPTTTNPAKSQSTTLQQPTTVSSNQTTLAPGVTTRGVTDPWELAQAHRRTLGNSSFTVVGNQTIRENGTIVVQSNSETQVAQSDERYSLTATATGDNVESYGVAPYNITVWSNETTTVQRIDYRNGTIEHRELSPKATFVRGDITDWTTVYELFTAVNTSVTRTIEREGRTLYEVVSTGSPHPTSSYAKNSNFTLTAYVSPNGVVHEYEVAYVTTRIDRRVQVSRHVQYTNLGTTDVEQPAWATKAIDNETTMGTDT